MTVMLMIQEATVPYETRSDTALTVPVPSAFAWLDHLEADEQAEFYAQLLEATAFCQRIGQWDRLKSLLESWKERAERRTHPELQRRMVEARARLPEDRQRLWPKLRGYLESLYALEMRLRAFEARFGMSSEAFYQKMLAGEIEEDTETLEWAGSFRVWKEELAMCMASALSNSCLGQ
ncbi:MAG: hypothetical protein MAG451_02616 [Anaerolineales bacterium]|nr:hypothetical protein [Anaerolineales bacterium]